MTIARQDGDQQFVGVGPLSPWTPAWSMLETSAPTPVLNEGTSFEASLQTKHFRWCAPNSEDSERSLCLDQFPSLDVYFLTEDLDFSAHWQVEENSSSCSSTYSYSSS